LTFNFSEQLQAQRSAKKGPPCTISVILSELDKDDRSALVAALTDKTVEHTAIYKVLTRNGFRVSIHTVQRHRRGECLCGTD
jgi:hypothetical protein